MPGGKSNIKPEDGKPYSSEYQPKNRRKSTKFLTDLLTKNLKKRTEIIIEGIDIKTRKKVKVKISLPSKETIVQALLKQAGKGNMLAIREVFDRIEGKPLQTNAIGFDFENATNEQLDFVVNALLERSNSNNY